MAQILPYLICFGLLALLIVVGFISTSNKQKKKEREEETIRKNSFYKECLARGVDSYENASFEDKVAVRGLMGAYGYRYTDERDINSFFNDCKSIFSEIQEKEDAEKRRLEKIEKQKQEDEKRKIDALYEKASSDNEKNLIRYLENRKDSYIGDTLHLYKDNLWDYDVRMIMESNNNKYNILVTQSLIFSFPGFNELNSDLVQTSLEVKNYSTSTARIIQEDASYTGRAVAGALIGGTTGALVGLASAKDKNSKGGKEKTVIDSKSYVSIFLKGHKLRKIIVNPAYSNEVCLMWGQDPSNTKTSKSDICGLIIHPKVFPNRVNMLVGTLDENGEFCITIGDYPTSNMWGPTNAREMYMNSCEQSIYTITEIQKLPEKKASKKSPKKKTNKKK